MSQSLDQKLRLWIELREQLTAQIQQHVDLGSPMPEVDRIMLDVVERNVEKCVLQKLTDGAEHDDQS